jgi:hypothetical protein
MREPCQWQMGWWSKVEERERYSARVWNVKVTTHLFLVPWNQALLPLPYTHLHHDTSAQKQLYILPFCHSLVSKNFRKKKLNSALDKPLGRAIRTCEHVWHDIQANIHKTINQKVLGHKH